MIDYDVPYNARYIVLCQIIVVLEKGTRCWATTNT